MTVAATTLTVEIAGPIARLTFARPNQLNALSRVLLTELIAVCGELDRQPDVKVVVVSGAGRAFSAGFDLGDFANPDPTVTPAQTVDLGRRAADALEHVGAVTIAAIHGHCVGGGVVLAAACDLRIAAASARFAIPEIDLGIPLAWGGIPRLVRELGPARTRELVMTGRSFTADAADRWGFVNRVAADDALGTEVDALAAVLAAKPALALRATKQQVAIAADGLASTRHSDADAALLAAAQRDPEALAVAHEYLAGRRR